MNSWLYANERTSPANTKQAVIIQGANTVTQAMSESHIPLIGIPTAIPELPKQQL